MSIKKREVKKKRKERIVPLPVVHEGRSASFPLAHNYTA